MRFQELRDEDGTVVARGIHPAVAVVSASALARVVVTSPLRSKEGCRIVSAADVDDQVRQAEEEAQRQHEAALAEKRAQVQRAEAAVAQAIEGTAKAVQEASVAAGHVACFDDLADGLGSAQESYEASVRADAEAARGLAAALAELDHTLGQRHSASTSLEQARMSRDNGTVPEAVVQQALNLQAALAKAESDRYQAVQQADEISRSARAATREALYTLEAAMRSLSAGVASIGTAPPSWGPGIPLPGLVGNYRDQLASALAVAQNAETDAKTAESTAQKELEQYREDLRSLESVTLPLTKPQETVLQWVSSDEFDPTSAVFVDDAFSTYGPAEATSFINALAARGCQVIYLTEDRELLGWAIGLPHEVGGASTLSSSKSRSLASVGG